MEDRKEEFPARNLLDLTKRPSSEYIEKEICRLTEELEPEHHPKWDHFTCNTSRINLYQNELSRRSMEKNNKNATLWSLLGIIVMLLIFIANILYNNYRDNNYLEKKNNNIIKVVKSSLSINLEGIKANKEILKRDSSALNSNKSVVIPLFILNDDFFDILNENIPEKILSNKLYENLYGITYITKQTNEIIKSREMFKNVNWSTNTNNYYSRLQAYDDELLNLFNQLDTLSTTVNKQLNKI